MKMSKFCIAMTILGFAILPAAWPRDVPPIVTTEWLQQNLGVPGTAVIDIRTAAQFQKGHIPGSVSAPLGLWAITNHGLSLELPSDDALRDVLGKSGISNTSKVVIVTRTETDFSRADGTRVAWTCKVAGLENVAVLDGGYTKWARENKTIATDSVSVAEVTYTGRIDRSSVASKPYLLRGMKKITLVDNRVPEDYFGITPKSGHIKGAINLPTPWVFNTDGTYRTQEDLRYMAAGVLGADKKKEIVVYCGVGGYASTWWFLLTQVLGYQNVKLYDGSFEEWVLDPQAPVQSYTWR